MTRKADDPDWAAKSFHDPKMIRVPIAALRKWRERLEPHWFTADSDGEEYNNDGVIETCREIDELLKGR